MRRNLKRLLALAMVLALILSGLCDSRFQVLAQESTEAETEVLEEQESAEEEQKEDEASEVVEEPEKSQKNWKQPGRLLILGKQQNLT